MRRFSNKEINAALKEGSALNTSSINLLSVGSSMNEQLARQQKDMMLQSKQIAESSGPRGFRHCATFSVTNSPSQSSLDRVSTVSASRNKAVLKPTNYTPAYNDTPKVASAQMLSSDWSGNGPNSAQSSSSSVYLPGDKVIFTMRVSAPGVPVVYREPEERASNPDRLNLDRRRLTVCPILEGEDQLRLLNYQHNMITAIENMSTFKRLIFLDLYDNRITQIVGLDSLRSLRVLMLGKNRIQKIENLHNLTKLDVLDLHGNEISRVEKLQHLGELRVLNLAGNNIGWVDNLRGMDTLTELNLRRNQITSVMDVESLPNLQRLFLSFNRIASFDDVACLSDSPSITEVSFDGNPFAQDPQHRAQVIGRMKRVKQFNMQRISDEERRMAAIFSKKDDEKKKEISRHTAMKEQRKHAIQNAKRQWEVSQGGIMLRTSRMVRAALPDLYATHAGSYEAPPSSVRDMQTCDDNSSQSSCSRQSKRSMSARSCRSEMSTVGSSTVTASGSSRLVSRPASMTSPIPTDKDEYSPATSGKDYLADLDGATLSLYGLGSLEAFDRNWGMQAAGAVNTIMFRFIDFDEIVRQLHKIRARFPNVQTLVFNSTNICQLRQLNALSALRKLDHLVVSNEGNPLTKFTLWRAYIVYRLSHFSLKTINDVEVSATDIVNAEKFFGVLGHLTMSQLSQSRLIALLTEAKKKQLLLAEDKTMKKIPGTDLKYVDRSIEPVAKAALIYTLPQPNVNKGRSQKLENVSEYVRGLAQDAIITEERLRSLQEAWPQILTGLVKRALAQVSEIQSRKRTEDLETG